MNTAKAAMFFFLSFGMVLIVLSVLYPAIGFGYIPFGIMISMTSVICLWILFGSPFPFIPIGCYLNLHPWHTTDDPGIGQLFWYGHYNADGSKRYIYVDASTVQCTRCKKLAIEYRHKVENYEYLVRHSGEAKAKEMCIHYEMIKDGI